MDVPLFETGTDDARLTHIEIPHCLMQAGVGAFPARTERERNRYQAMRDAGQTMLFAEPEQGSLL